MLSFAKNINELYSMLALLLIHYNFTDITDIMFIFFYNFLVH